MNAGGLEQKNLYKGTPARPWIQLRFAAQDGAQPELVLLADTGCPFSMIISQDWMTKLKLGDALDVHSNFGLLTGGWLHAVMPELSLDTRLIGYASDAVILATKTSSSDFEGLAGLPLLRMLEYGGDADYFWLRPAFVPPSNP